TESARGVDPNERLGMKDERLEELERLADELGVRHRGHPADADLEAARGENPPAERAVRGAADHRLERGRRSPEPSAELRHLARTGAGLPDQDLEPSARLDVLRQREDRPVAEERRARERVEERPLDDAIVSDARNAIPVPRALRDREEGR